MVMQVSSFSDEELMEVSSDLAEAGNAINRPKSDDGMSQLFFGSTLNNAAMRTSLDVRTQAIQNANEGGASTQQDNTHDDALHDDMVRSAEGFCNIHFLMCSITY